jgi:hypothetical protein
MGTSIIITSVTQPDARATVSEFSAIDERQDAAHCDQGKAHKAQEHTDRQKLEYHQDRDAYAGKDHANRNDHTAARHKSFDEGITLFRKNDAGCVGPEILG